MYCSDPLRTAKGRLSLKALRLTPTMMSMYHDGDFTHDACVYLNYHLIIDACTKYLCQECIMIA